MTITDSLNSKKKGGEGFMAKIINISDKLSLEKPKLVVGDKIYTVKDGMDTVMKFEELAAASTADSLTQAIEISLGKEAADELDIKSWSLANFKVLTIAILAAMQGIEYDEAASRFQDKVQ